MWNEAIAQAYARAVKAGRRNLDEIKPNDLKQRVIEILSEMESSIA